MEVVFEQVTFTLSIIAGVLSLVTVFISMGMQILEKKSVINQIKEEKLDQVLKSDDLHKLGSYLEETLSEVSIYQYSKNPEVEKQFDRYLEEIKEFVGTSEEIEREEIPEEPEGVDIEIGFYDVFPELANNYKTVIEELNEGEPWNALARLRRNIELKLNEIGKRKGLIKSDKIPLRRLINILHKEGVISYKARKNLDYAVTVSNKAVHGINIEFNTASEAIAMAFSALQEIEAE